MFLKVVVVVLHCFKCSKKLAEAKMNVVTLCQELFFFQERDRRSYPPRNRLEMTVNMTGSERFHYEEWKAERQKVDQERMDRQKTSSGEWRRAWDQEKHFKE